MAAPEILVRRGLDRGLMGSTLASAAIHAAVLALLVTMPGRFLSPPSKMESYTVDLVAPDVLGGTNLIPGGGQAKAPAIKAGPPMPSEPKPEPVAVQPPAPAPPKEPPPVEPAKPPPPAEAMKPVELPKPVEPPKVVEPPKPVEPPKAVQEVPKPAAPPPKPPEAKPAAPKPAPIADAKPPEPKPAPKAVEAPPPAKPVAPAKPAPVAAAKPVEPPKKPVEPAKPAPVTNPIDDEIAAAVQRRAAQVQSGAGGANRDLDNQIAAAVARRAQQVGAGAGSGASGAGGPVSLGPASGAGGTPAGIDYILYQGKMEQKIKAAWAWAGADKSLRAVLQFNLEPDGQIKNVRTVESSGDTQYDASCERAVRAVNPLEPVPERYRKEFATVELTFKPEDVGR
jgi:TonB family protein